MNLSADFFRDEVRSGFYIPTAIKQAWAATLDVLGEVDRICVKHNIKYFADWGTFLGTVRHGGFVPWDDDLDICMLRDDYEKFRQVVDKELREGMVIHDYDRKDDHWLFLARVVNNDKMCFEETYLDAHNNFPWLAGVDIFLKDYLYMDDDKETERDKDIMKLVALTEGIVEGELSDEAIRIQLQEIENKHHVKIPNTGDANETGVALYKLAEQLMSAVKPEGTTRVGQIFPFMLKNGPSVAEPKELYEEFIRLPFEDTTIPVPLAYNTLLTRRYGDYCVPRKVWTGHDYPFFEGQKDDIEGVTGEKLPEFTFKPSMLERPVVDTSNSLRETAKMCLVELERLIDIAEQILQGGTLEQFVDAINEVQQLAVDFGNLVEHVKGEKRESTIAVVNAIQSMCDSLFEEFELVNSGETINGLTKTRIALNALDDAVGKYIIDRREILFLPIGPREWKSLEPYYGKCDTAREDVFIVPLPLMRKRFYGRVEMTADEIEEAIHLEDYPKGIEYDNWATYDISIHSPDEVYVQFVYDGENPCLTIPTDFYSENIRRFSLKIIYMPIADTDEFCDNDINDIYNMKHYVTAPAVIYADEIRVQSENIKQQYINVLTDFAGNNTEDVWSNKIVMSDMASNISTNEGGKKRIVYCIGINELVEHKDVVTDAVVDRLKTMEESLDNLDVSITFFPDDRDTWKAVREELSSEVFDIVDGYLNDNRMEYLSTNDISGDEIAETYDAYYGSPSPLVTSFWRLKKPVMLSNYDL